jgi:hypothetical protein
MSPTSAANVAVTVAFIAYFLVFIALGLWFARANHVWALIMSNRGLLPELPSSWPPQAPEDNEWLRVGRLIRNSAKARHLLRLEDSNPEAEKWRQLTLRRYALAGLWTVIGLLIPLGAWLGTLFAHEIIDLASWSTPPILLLMLLVVTYTLFRLGQLGMAYGRGEDVATKSVVTTLGLVLVVIAILGIGVLLMN